MVRGEDDIMWEDGWVVRAEEGGIDRSKVDQVY